MEREQLKKYLRGLDLPKKRIDIEDPQWGRINLLWLKENILVRNHGDIANLCHREICKLWESSK